MKVGARNQLKGRVTDIERGDVMAQINEVTTDRGIDVTRRTRKIQGLLPSP